MAALAPPPSQDDDRIVDWLKQAIDNAKEDPRAMLDALQTAINVAELPTFAPILSLLFVLDGKPLSLQKHFVFRETYRRAQPKRAVYVTARQLGKCHVVTETSRVRLADGREVTVPHLRVGDRILALDDERLKFRVQRVEAIHDTGVQECFRVRTRLGTDLTVPASHPFRTLRGYTRVADLHVGSRVAACRSAGEFRGEDQPDDRVAMTALMLGDGSTGAPHFNFNCGKPALAAVMREIADRYQENPSRLEETPGKTPILHLSKRSRLRPWVESDGLWGKLCHEKFVPGWVFALGRAQTVRFLELLWATDGGVKQHRSQRSPHIDYTSTSSALARDVRALLAKFGIATVLRRRKVTLRGKRCRDAYVVRVATREGWRRFQATFSVPGKPPVALPTTRENNNRDTIPIEFSELIEAAIATVPRRKGDTLYAAGLRRSPEYALTYGKAARYVEWVEARGGDAAALRAVVESDVFWDEVVSIEPAGAQKTVDLTVSGDHNFLLDGLVSHNTISEGVWGLSTCASLPNFRVIYITPLYEQVRRISSDVVHKLITNSPFKALFTDTGAGSVLTRKFKNGSQMTFSYAGRDCDRTRGLSADVNVYDEFQDFNKEHVAIIRETISASEDYEWERFYGTAKSWDNVLSQYYRQSSMAEWFVRCTTGGCNEWNIPSVEYHAIKMIGRDVASVSEKTPGVVCHKCQKPLDPANHGLWVPRSPELHEQTPGYHIPRIVMPLHYSKPAKWAEVLAKMAGVGGVAPNVFYNEVLGEPYDRATKLVTMEDLRRCSQGLCRNDAAEFQRIRSAAAFWILGVDWGGGGGLDPKNSTSFTKAALVGLGWDGKLLVPWGLQLYTPHDPIKEAMTLLHWIRVFNPAVIAHDYNGAGEVRQAFLTQGGLPESMFMNCVFRGPAKGAAVEWTPANEWTLKDVHQIDKSRCLMTLCKLIQLGGVRFFDWDRVSDSEPGLISDFLSLVEEKVKTGASPREAYRITNADGSQDDFAHAVCFAAVAAWHRTQQWPNLFTWAQTAMANGFYTPE